MSHRKYPSKGCKNLLILGIIWLLGAVCDRIWFALDRSIPAWDQADYLTGTLNYWQALQNPQWWDSEWWQSFWTISSKIPPLTYILAAVVQNIFGTGPDQAALVMLLFSAILLGSVYGLGTALFNSTVGLWAAALCQVIPALYVLRLNFLLDYPLTSAVTFSFFCFTLWQVTLKKVEGNSDKGTRGQGVEGGEELIRVNSSPFSPSSLSSSSVAPPPLLLAAVFGLSLGLALLVKQTALFFLFTPIAWVGFTSLRQRRWGQLAQLLGALLLSTLVFAPWYRANWLLILTSGKRATIDSAIAEDDPPLNTLEAWTYYWHHLPAQVSWPLLLIPIFALLLYWGLTAVDDAKTRRGGDAEKLSKIFPVSPAWSLKWLAIFWIGAYLLSSLNPNKDDRYVLPYLPVLTVFLAYGLTRLRSLWGQRIRWGTFGLAVLLMLFNLFPIGGFIGNGMTLALSPNARQFPNMKEELPLPQVIAQIVETEPYLRSTLGVLPSTKKINQHNLNYYGRLANFQVYGRQVGVKKKFVQQDARSLSWFLSKAGKQGSVPKAQALMVKTVEEDGNFQLHKTWTSGDTTLKLYHQQTPPIEVKQISQQQPQAQIALLQVTVPEKAPPQVPVPVTYEWNGSWEELQNGIVLLTWRNLSAQESGEKTASTLAREKLWIHDHGIGMGNLYAGANKPQGTFRVIERLAMLPPADVTPGNYALEAMYLNRVSGETYPIPVPKVTLQIDPQAAPATSPELDLLTQLRVLAANLPQGTKALEQLFAEIGRINQYDPIQDYLEQARLSLEYRLQQDSQNRDWAYALALANVLQKRVSGAIAALEQVTQLDSENPYAWAYLAFVQLYNWQPRAAEKSLQPSLTKNPDSQEIQALNGVAALMQGKVIQAWQIYQKLGARG
ncbi:glycosyltransferase family 39 protein [Chlorogloeopsis fritschii PCC 9212]|uniref:glycosyltransferase family 39 protein n=1 Tax=Chlorogloeopsis fritschii TaxID=1124 RepID=UPI00037BA3B0|nr:glycosyltransferase family 39 protein [Chlorogloeopsis fritschii]